MTQNAQSRADMPCELVSWERFDTLARTLARQIRDSGDRVDLIVGIDRGGYMPARMISDILGIMNLASFKIEHDHGSVKSKAAFVRYPLVADVAEQHILLVDDVSDSGDTFHVALQHIESRGKPKQVKTAVLHHKTVSTFEPEYYAAVVKKWRWIIYPWAVTEDLAVLIGNFELATRDIETIQHQLMEHHGIEPSVEQVEDALALIG
jgi:hypoxanthine phosphoribosyltransferase